MLSIAFKEWAAVCHALAKGSQSLILRKGGIAETDGEFRPGHDTFFLYPTHFHETHQKGLNPNAAPFLEAAKTDRPPAGVVRISHFVRVERVFKIRSLDISLCLNPFHVWTDETVSQRFQYRSPGLYAFVVRTFALPAAVEIPEDPSYAGCKSWVPLTKPVPIDGATAVLEDQSFRRVVDEIRRLI